MNIKPLFLLAPLVLAATGALAQDNKFKVGIVSIAPNSTASDVTGAFTPLVAHGVYGVPVDNTAAFWQDFGNGPEWAFSTPPGAPGGLRGLTT